MPHENLDPHFGSIIPVTGQDQDHTIDVNVYLYSNIDHVIFPGELTVLQATSLSQCCGGNNHSM